MIQSCSPCRPGPAATFQDATYGKGLRVFTKSGKASDQYRCTVCGATIKK